MKSEKTVKFFVYLLIYIMAVAGSIWLITDKENRLYKLEKVQAKERLEICELQIFEAGLWQAGIPLPKHIKEKLRGQDEKNKSEETP